MKEKFIEQNESKNESINESSSSGEIKSDKNISSSKEYSFGWGQYSEITNGRFAMVGFTAIILIEMISNKSFLNWAGFMH